VAADGRRDDSGTKGRSRPRRRRASYSRAKFGERFARGRVTGIASRLRRRLKSAGRVSPPAGAPFRGVFAHRDYHASQSDDFDRARGVIATDNRNATPASKFPLASIASDASPRFRAVNAAPSPEDPFESDEFLASVSRFIPCRDVAGQTGKCRIAFRKSRARPWSAAASRNLAVRCRQRYETRKVARSDLSEVAVPSAYPRPINTNERSPM
jgi:hypothetical protein